MLTIARFDHPVLVPKVGAYLKHQLDYLYRTRRTFLSGSILSEIRSLANLSIRADLDRRYSHTVLSIFTSSCVEVAYAAGLLRNRGSVAEPHS